MKITVKHVTSILTLLVSGGIAQAQSADEPVDPGCDPDPTVACPDRPAPPPVSQPVSQPPVVESAPVVETNIYTAATETDSRTWLERTGMAISAGGGVSDFTDSDTRDVTGLGGGWEVRLSLGTRSYFGVEASYIGSAQDIDAIGLDTGTTLVGNGLQAAARINILKDYMVQPFLYGGIAWRHYSLSGNDFNTSDINESDDVLEIPVGVGVAFKYAGFLLDARGEFRAADGEDLFAENFDAQISSPDLHRWGLNMTVGYEF